MLQKQEPANIWLSRIADIGEELWMYSKNRELLVNENDKQYLSDNLYTIKIRIDKIIEENKSIINNEALLAIMEFCSKVYQGETFGDKEYNDLISYVQLASKECKIFN